jgi:hypothetical protein
VNLFCEPNLSSEVGSLARPFFNPVCVNFGVHSSDTILAFLEPVLLCSNVLLFGEYWEILIHVFICKEQFSLDSILDLFLEYFEPLFRGVIGGAYMLDKLNLFSLRAPNTGDFSSDLVDLELVNSFEEMLQES